MSSDAEVLGHCAFPSDAVRACLERLAVSRQFARSRRLQDFLRFTVEARLEGRTDELKERTIAVEVYGRALDYDPRCDPIVRSEAHRLRAQLAAYYAGAGCGDPIVIEYPRGSYVPVFRPNAPGVGGGHPSPCRIAVASFEDRSPRGGEPELSLGMGEALSARLAGRPGLRVVYRVTGQKTRRGGAGRLEADFVVEGGFERAGDRCVLRVEVVRVADRQPLWDDAFDFPWDRVAEVQDEVAERVARAVGSFLARAGGPRPPVRPRAYELFLKGHHSVLEYANTMQREHAELARGRLVQAVELEPGFADARADLAFLELLGQYPPRDDFQILLERARTHLERSLASEPRHVRSIYLLGHVHGVVGRLRQGLDLTETAVALDPDDAEARTFLALRYGSLGFYEAAVAACDQAIVLDPVWAWAYLAKAVYATYFGASAAALRSMEAVRREMGPGGAQVDAGFACVHLAQGDLAGAERALARAEAQASPGTDVSYLEILRGLVAVLQGDTALGGAIFKAYRNSPPRIQDHLLRLALALGEGGSALERLASSPYHRNYRWLVGEPLARPFLREPGYRKLLEELHAEWLRNLDDLGPRLPAAPPALPPPEVILSRADVANPS